MTGFNSKRNAAKAKLDDDDDTQVYADTLLIVYQRGFADGKKAAQPEQEPTCPKCKAAVLYECVACSNNNYPPRPEQDPCIGKDPRCPCQDGDACHYKDCGSTKARPVAQPEQEPVAFAAEITEDVNGVLSTRWADWWIPNEGDKLYTTPPAAQPDQQAEPVADGNKVICPACCHQFRAIPTAVQTLMLNAGFEPPFVTPPAAQRKWVGLTDDEIDYQAKKDDHGVYFALGALWAEANLKERNNGH